MPADATGTPLPHPTETGPLSGFSFVAEPLDRADALRDDGKALAALWPQARVLVIDLEGLCFADADGNLLAPTGEEIGGGPGQAIFLGMRGQVAWFAISSDVIALEVPGRMELRQAASEWAHADSTAFAQARALLHWQRKTRHCSVCGGKVEYRRAGYTARCTQCRAEHYPRMDPAVIMAVSDGQRLLMGRQASWPPNRYSVVAGFVEPGESLEQTVAREVMEETRIRVRAARYLGSQPWPFPGALMLGFEADAEAGVPTVNGELEDARWFTVEEVGAAIRGEGTLLLSPRISISRSLIEHWYRKMTA
ncbi:NAD+ diphosphatase [Pseudoxanthomonas sp. GM95]|uniref:NAD(+) diphosphatase n=1 Tax=Pseudoxanthomonas sp. GM95 TaxID=1881043 RepID=UPI0008C5775A|nr:NAD(+) diphosphatase [Pseudoxanthomonas sp. GM95]SEL48753.1 NAD+ diphosphatase [Pseudoxanthomonas sp. GM95]